MTQTLSWMGNVLFWNALLTWSIPGCHLHSQSLVCIFKKIFIVGIGPILNKELEFIFQPDRSDRTSEKLVGVTFTSEDHFPKQKRTNCKYFFKPLFCKNFTLRISRPGVSIYHNHLTKHKTIDWIDLAGWFKWLWYMKTPGLEIRRVKFLQKSG